MRQATTLRRAVASLLAIGILAGGCASVVTGEAVPVRTAAARPTSVVSTPDPPTSRTTPSTRTPAPTGYRQDNVRQSQEAAAAVLENRSVAQCFDDVLGRTLAVLTDADLNRVVEVDGVGAMRLMDWLVTRVISIAAHGLDVALTVERPWWTTPLALRTIRPGFPLLS